MARAKEFTVTIEDKPGALGRCFRALAEKGVNILAFQSFVEEGESLMRMIVSDPAMAKATLGGMRMIFEETEAATATLDHKRGKAGRAGREYRLFVLRTAAGRDEDAGGVRR